MIKAIVDEEAMRSIIHERIQALVKEVDGQRVFWDFKQLAYATSMSVNYIKEQFFFDPRFPKYKVGGKWMFPAKETREFLITWLKEQPR